MEITIVKDVTWAIGGVDIVDFKAGETVQVPDVDGLAMCKCNFADSEVLTSKPDPEPDDSEEFDIAKAEKLAESGDKDGLDDYAAKFGFKLDRKFKIENMLAKLKEQI